jgi:hypothetical protein
MDRPDRRPGSDGDNDTAQSGVRGDPALVVSVRDRAAAATDRGRVTGQSDRDLVSPMPAGWSAVIAARVAGCERLPGASLRIVFLAVEQQHVIIQQDQE